MIELAFFAAAVCMVCAGFVIYVQNPLWFSEMWSARDRDIVAAILVIMLILAAIATVATVPQLAIG